jgi:hypothetical protein
MKVFIPYSKHKPIAKEVLDSIKGVIIPIDCTWDNVDNKLQRIILSENKMKETALKESWDLCVYHQSDIINIMDNNFEVMQKFLLDRPDFGAIAASRYPLSEVHPLIAFKNSFKLHICSGCTMFTRKGMEIVKFDLNKQSTCFSIAESLRDSNFQYGYVDRFSRIRHSRG